jgi:hypothetical protein
MRSLGVLLALSILFCSNVAAEELITRVFQLTNRPAEATVEMVRPWLSPSGTVMAETRLQKLIVRDTRDRLAEVERLLAEIDQPAPQVLIQVAMSGSNPVHGQQAGVMVQGDLRHPQIALQAGAHVGDSSVQTQQSLLVMSGERGVITVARDLVTVDPYLHFVSRYGLPGPGLLVQTVSTGFAVEPVVVGDVVRLTVTPWLGFMGAGGRTEVLMEQASSTVAVRSGQEVTLASGSSREEFQAAAYGLVLAGASRSNQRSVSITVRPEILPPMEGPP